MLNSDHHRIFFDVSFFSRTFPWNLLLHKIGLSSPSHEIIQNQYYQLCWKIIEIEVIYISWWNVGVTISSPAFQLFIHYKHLENLLEYILSKLILFRSFLIFWILNKYILSHAVLNIIFARNFILVYSLLFTPFFLLEILLTVIFSIFAAPDFTHCYFLNFCCSRFYSLFFS